MGAMPFIFKKIVLIGTFKMWPYFLDYSSPSHDVKFRIIRRNFLS